MTFAIDARLVSGTSTGDSTYWTELIRAFARTASEDRFLLFTNAEPPSTIPEDPRIRWIRLPARSSRWWSLVSFPVHARRMGADVVHVQYSLSPLAGRRAVTTVHDVSFLIGPEWFKPRDRMLMRLSVPAACRRAARVIAVSETSRQEIEKLIPAARGKTRTVYNACPSWIRRLGGSEARQIASSRFGLDEPFLLTVGTRWPRKNMNLAIEAAAALPYPLAVTGKAGWGDAELGLRGRALGYVDEQSLSALYSAAALYLAPSLHEGFGIPLLEAFRCGCPVLCSTGGALPEIAGDAAEVEPTWSAEHWGDTIRSMLDDPSKLDRLRSRGVQREQRFSWDDAARQTLDVYRETLR